MDPILNKAKEYELHYFSCYDGYDGASLLKLEFSEATQAMSMRQNARDLGYESVIRLDNPKAVYVVFELPEDIFGLKRI